MVYLFGWNEVIFYVFFKKYGCVYIVINKIELWLNSIN